jgi:hypothetical protein
MNWNFKTWSTKKKVVVGVGLTVASYFAYRWWQKRSAAKEEEATTLPGFPGAGGAATGSLYRPMVQAARPVASVVKKQCESTANYVNSKSKIGAMSQALSSQCIAAGGMISTAKKGTTQARQVCMCPRTGPGVSGLAYDFEGRTFYV